MLPTAFTGGLHRRALMSHTIRRSGTGTASRARL
jgi:hypothetical protein